METGNLLYLLLSFMQKRDLQTYIYICVCVCVCVYAYHFKGGPCKFFDSYQVRIHSAKF